MRGLHREVTGRLRDPATVWRKDSGSSRALAEESEIGAAATT
jgi:hypothetical protein